MILKLIHNELIKVLYKRRTYISFILISILIPIIVYAIDYGAVSLQNKIYGQMQDSFIFIGTIINDEDLSRKKIPNDVEHVKISSISGKNLEKAIKSIAYLVDK